MSQNHSSQPVAFEDVLAEVLREYAPLIASQERSHGWRLQDGEAEQTARIVVFQLWTKASGDRGEVVRQFPKAYSWEVGGEARKADVIAIPARQRDRLKKAEQEDLPLSRDEQVILASVAEPVLRFSDIFGDEDDEPDLERLMKASYDVDLVEEGARTLVERAMKPLSFLERLVVTEFYLMGDNDTTDASVSYELTERSAEIFGQHRSLGVRYVNKIRNRALSVMRRELGLKIAVTSIDSANG